MTIILQKEYYNFDCPYLKNEKNKCKTYFRHDLEQNQTAQYEKDAR
jgi:hypothetical protein